MTIDRNDLIEQLDDWLAEELARQGVDTHPDARINSETPGSVIDRLSVLTLRIFYLEQQLGRFDLSESP